MKEAWLFQGAVIPVDTETTQALVAEIKRLIDVVGGMALECPNCEYHRQRAQRWREEAYKLSGHPLPEREWIGLTEDDKNEILVDAVRHEWNDRLIVEQIEDKLKEKNT